MRCEKIAKSLIIGLLMLLVSTGCSSRTLDELYTLPKQSDAYVDLQKRIDEVLATGAVYCGPVSGTNQQPVQLVDLDGDGEDEAVVFLKASGDSPLKTYVFARQNEGYVTGGVVSGDGACFDTVEYAQLDGEPGLEVVIGRRLNGQVLKSLSAYKYHEGQMIEMVSSQYSEFRVSDLDDNSKEDIVVFRLENEEWAGVAELYRCKDGRMLCEYKAGMSVGAKQIRRILAGDLEGDVPAFFVSSSYEENATITDVFAMVDGVFKNVAIASQREFGVQIVQNDNVYATDIDADGTVELPSIHVLPSYVAGEEAQWIIEWYGLTSKGNLKSKMWTYHNYSDGWYLKLPVHWRNGISIRVEMDDLGTTVYTVSKWIDYDNEPQMVVEIHAVTGKNDARQTLEEGEFLLAEKGDTSYIALLGQCDWAQELTQEDLTDMFRFIYGDWNWNKT